MLFNAFSSKKKKEREKRKGRKNIHPFRKGVNGEDILSAKKNLFVHERGDLLTCWWMEFTTIARTKTRTVSSTQSEKWCSRCWDSDEFEVDDGWMRLLRSWNTTFEYEFKLLLGKNLCCWRCFFFQKVVRDYGNDGWWFSFLLIKISKIYSFIVNREDVKSLILRNREG